MSVGAAITGIDFLLNIIDRLSSASTLVRRAHEEGRQVTSEELAGLRAETEGYLNDLDAAIINAKHAGR